MNTVFVRSGRPPIKRKVTQYTKSYIQDSPKGREKFREEEIC